MFGHKAFSLLEEIDRSDHGIPPYRDALVREVCDEVNELCKSLQHVNESDGEQVQVCATDMPSHDSDTCFSDRARGHDQRHSP